MRRCPTRHYRGAVGVAVAAAMRARDGVMPVAGGQMDQCAAFLDVCGVVDGEIARVREEEREAADAARR